MEYMYMRVSSKDQNLDRQEREADKLGIKDNCRIRDKESGKDFERAGYQYLVNSLLEEGDVVYVSSLDRLGRDYDMILEEWRKITNMGVDIVVLDMPLLDTRHSKDLTGKLISDIVLQLLSYVAETERRKIKKRQRAGIEAAKEAGKHLGRPRVEVDKEEFARLQRAIENKERTHPYAMKVLGLKQTSYYKLLREYRGRTGYFKDFK